ncbi:hypothetical protein FKM82_017063 [Ascaphus truei]
MDCFNASSTPLAVNLTCPLLDWPVFASRSGSEEVKIQRTVCIAIFLGFSAVLHFATCKKKKKYFKYFKCVFFIVLLSSGISETHGSHLPRNHHLPNAHQSKRF